MYFGYQPFPTTAVPQSCLNPVGLLYIDIRQGRYDFEKRSILAMTRAAYIVALDYVSISYTE